MANQNIPFQVQNLIESIGNKKENVYLRGNYRLRLNEIKIAVEKAMKTYDEEVFAADMNARRKKKS
jgi:hypothetical protein